MVGGVEVVEVVESSRKFFAIREADAIDGLFVRRKVSPRQERTHARTGPATNFF
jgi:hypothetical protein